MFHRGKYIEEWTRLESEAEPGGGEKIRPKRIKGATTIGDIVDAVCDTMDVDAQELNRNGRNTRRPGVVVAREMVSAIASRCGYSFPDMARWFGGGGHSTYVSAAKRGSERHAERIEYIMRRYRLGPQPPRCSIVEGAQAAKFYQTEELPWLATG